MVEKKKPGFTSTKKWREWFPKQTVQGWRDDSRAGVTWSVIEKQFEMGPDWHLAQVKRLLPGVADLRLYV